ncbi:MAG TPA: hypothetical protein VFB63_03230 [Bryobacteraceae bacterium]|nr:hypothetical protein [Bryobacteraceae bacterium]
MIAAARARAANIFYRPDHFKVDLFPLTDDPLQQSQLRRARETGQSARQWEDMRGIVQTSGTRLDLGYLREWSANLRLAIELERLLDSVPPRN